MPSLLICLFTRRGLLDQRISSTGVTPRIPSPAEITTHVARASATFAADVAALPS